MTDQKQFAFYSAKADEEFGHTVYARENGEHVKATCVSADEASFETYNWPDKENRGVVVRFVSAHHKKLPPHLQNRFENPMITNTKPFRPTLF